MAYKIDTKEYQKQYQEKNKEKIHNQKKLKYLLNENIRKKIKKTSREYRINNKEEIKLYNKLYREKNKELININRKKYYNKIYKNSNFRLKKILRVRLRKLVKGINKSQSTMQLLGCSIDELKSHLQNTAINNGYLNFNINNYNGFDYHIDHIKPCASFDLTNPKQQLECFNWNNLQILDAKENLSKGKYYCE